MRCHPLLVVCSLTWACAACAATFELSSGASIVSADLVEDDPSVRILTGRPLPLDFELASSPTALESQNAARAALGWTYRAEDAQPVSVLRWSLALPGAGPWRSARAYVGLASGGQTATALRQWRPAAGVVMDLRGTTGWPQQMSLGSALRFDMADGAQVALRFKGGRLGVQYRLQFSL